MPRYVCNGRGRRSGFSWGGGFSLNSNFGRNDIFDPSRLYGNRFGVTNVFRYGNNTNNDNSNTNNRGHQPAVCPYPRPKDVLSIEGVDLQIQENTKAHKTDEYEICQGSYQASPKLVVRRGQFFNIKLVLSKDYDKNKDDLRIVFQAGDDPQSSKGTEIDLVLSDKDEPKNWGAKILRQQDKHLWLTIFTPPSCFVGKWSLNIDVIKKVDNDVKLYSYNHEDPIYIIFNPWCKDDVVYLGDDKLLEEYVMNESGRIFSGSKNNISSKPWNFGQFESCVLDVALYLLDISGVPWSVRGNPIPITRKLSAAVNSSDEGGVLTGNWSGDYSGGHSPLSWTGSADILEKFWQTKRPVKFGQCWVFSGLCTTVARALGIPARSVTNFASAHDTDGSITIDINYDKDGEPEDNNPDSIWNFHVWNEAWMSRPDLPAGFGGWQAFDATPQETSDGVYCCGPVSVAAIRQGEVNMPFDAPFVFAEVNADRVYWQPDEYGRMKNVYTESKLVGKNISTKKPGSDYERDDITNQYKPKEGSQEERAAVLKANQLASTRKEAYTRTTEDVKFAIHQDAEKTWVGEDYKMELKMHNSSQETRTVSGRIVVKTMYYTGVPSTKISTVPFTAKVLNKGESETVSVSVKADDYRPYLQDCCMLDLSVWATVTETNQCFVAKEDHRLRKPHLTVKGPSEAVKGQEIFVDVSFTNPFDTSLTDCSVVVDGLSRVLRFPQGNVGPKGTFMAKLPITPAKIGQKQLIMCFNSRQLDDINASKRVFVRANSF